MLSIHTVSESTTSVALVTLPLELSLALSFTSLVGVGVEPLSAFSSVAAAATPRWILAAAPSKKLVTTST